jgi:ATP-binding cassette, subfamily B, bacterial
MLRRAMLGKAGMLNSMFTRSRVRVLWEFIVPHKTRLFLILALTLMSSALGLSYPLLARFFIDVVLASRSSYLLVLTTIALMAIVVLSFALGAITRYLSISTSAQILMQMRLHLFRHLQSLSLHFFRDMRMGDILSRLNSDVAEIQKVATDSVLSLVLSILTLAGTAGILVWLNWKLFVLCSFFIPFSVEGLRRCREPITRQARMVRERNASFASVLLESLGGIKFVKSVGTEEVEASRLARCNQNYIDSLLRYQIISNAGQAVATLFLSLSTLVVLFYGGHLVITGQMTLGTLVAFAAYQGRVLSPIQSLMGLYLGFQRAGVSLGRVFEILDRQPGVKEASHAVSLPQVRGELELREVSYAYHPGHEVLHDINLFVPAGARLAIVGPTGAGKTTLLDLVLRFYDPQHGQVLLDGHDLRTLQFKTLRDNIAVITQEPCLFRATIEENIRYANFQATASGIRRAARAAEVDEFIGSLPQGYLTVIGERGSGLSAGQRQRIAIARAILRKAKVWLFDEATADLDVLTETRIRETLDKWLDGFTSIIVSHRLSSVIDMDRIVVVKAGRIIQVGNHAQLMRTEGLYQQLYLASQRQQSISSSVEVVT